MPTGKNKKTLYKIPTEDEIQGAVPAKPLNAKPAPEVTPEVEEVLPVVEPEPVAVVDTAKEKEKAAAEALAKSEAKAADDAAKAAKLEAESVKAEAKAKEKAAREAKMADGYVFARSRVESDSMPDVPKMKKAKGKVAVTSEELKELKKTLDITQFDGISVAGRNVVVRKADRRITRDRRREQVDKYETVIVENAGETQELSEASVFMLDMLRKNPRRP